MTHLYNTKKHIYVFGGIIRACLKRRYVYVAAWPKLILAEMSTIVYDGGPSRKVKTHKTPLRDPPSKKGPPKNNH